MTAPVLDRTVDDPDELTVAEVDLWVASDSRYDEELTPSRTVTAGCGFSCAESGCLTPVCAI